MSLADEICRDLRRLEPWQVETVAELVGEFLREAEGDEPEAETAGNKTEGKEGARGWVELKMIPRGGKSYGPYAYLRWREGKVTRSKYLGKVRQSE